MTPAQITGWLLNGWRWIVIAALSGAILGVGIAQLITPRFTASTDLTIAPSNLQVVPNDIYVTNIQSDSQVLDVESKMRMITSRNVLNRVVDSLALDSDPEFSQKQRFPALGALFGAAAGADRTDIAGALAKRITVTRQERSFVVSLSVWTSKPETSARLANSIVATFREEVVRADAERTARAAEALTTRLDALRATAIAAEEATEAFRRANGLQQGASGQPLSSDAMDRMNAKLTDARARLAEAEARNNEVSRAVSAYGVDGGAIQSPTLSGLLVNDAASRRQIATLSQTLGPRHPALMSAMAEQEALSQAIAAETERLRRAARIDVDQARAALNSLDEETRSLRNHVSFDGQAQVKLRALERDADAKAALYETFTKRAGEAAARQQIDATDLRVISPAVAPLRSNWPPPPIVVAAIGAVLGLLAAAGALTGIGYLGSFGREKKAVV